MVAFEHVLVGHPELTALPVSQSHSASVRGSSRMQSSQTAPHQTHSISSEWPISTAGCNVPLDLGTGEGCTLNLLVFLTGHSRLLRNLTPHNLLRERLCSARINHFLERSAAALSRILLFSLGLKHVPRSPDLPRRFVLSI